jgi:hypothetical protein
MNLKTKLIFSILLNCYSDLYRTREIGPAQVISLGGKTGTGGKWYDKTW